MPSGYFSTPLIFLIDTLFSIYLGIIALRLIMQWAQWEYSNPLVQIIIRATQVPVKILRRFVPSIGRWDNATIVFLVTVTVIKLLLLSFLHPIPLTVFAVIREIFSLFIILFTASIIIQVILSWLAPYNDNPISPLINRMNAPLLNPVKRWLPPMSGLDLSPFVVILGLQILSMLVLPLLTGQY